MTDHEPRRSPPGRDTTIPYLPRFEFLNQLDALAETSFERDTPDGSLGAILIWHQITEEILRLVLLYSELWIKYRLHPVGFAAPMPKRAMFGQLLQLVEHSVDFDGKADVLSGATTLNAVRIDAVHKLTSLKSLDELRVMAQFAKKGYDEAFAGFRKGESWFKARLIAERAALSKDGARGETAG